MSVIESLKAVQSRYGYVPHEELYALAERLRVPVDEIYGVASFYPYFRLQPPARIEISVCTDLSCYMRGAQELKRFIEGEIESLGLAGAQTSEVSCLGQCDGAPAISINGRSFRGLTPQKMWTILRRLAEGKQPRRCRLPKMPKLFHGQIALLKEAAAEPFAGLKQLLKSGDFSSVVPLLKESGLRGMGGAGFPTWLKWEAVQKAAGEPKYVICNADESEPGTFKDRFLMQHFPELVLEGVLIAAMTVGASQAIIFIRHEYEREREILERELKRVKRLGFRFKGLGLKVAPTLNSQPSTLEALTLTIFESPGGYICGEETALLEALEGKRAEPRDRPPFPATFGLFGKPTLINNVETLVWAAVILRRGAKWFCGQGGNRAAGFKVFALSGDVKRPGVYLLPLGTSAADVIFRHGGGITNRRKLKAFAPGGVSAGFLPVELVDVPLDFESLANVGSMLGSGAVIAVADDRCMVDLACNALRFFHRESCGKCTPCRLGTLQMVEMLESIRRGQGDFSHIELLQELTETMQLTSICGLGQAAPNPYISVMKHFKDEVDAHLKTGKCQR